MPILISTLVDAVAVAVTSGASAYSVEKAAARFLVTPSWWGHRWCS